MGILEIPFPANTLRSNGGVRLESSTEDRTDPHRQTVTFALTMRHSDGTTRDSALLKNGRWLLVLILLGGCDQKAGTVKYVCEEPLEKYLELARANIENDYEVERSREVLATCPGKGFHRRYVFAFSTSAIVSKQPADARVIASWCNDSTEKTIDATISATPSVLTFAFTYPWSTATGKYPRTEFRLNKNTRKGGFFDELNWNCVLEQKTIPPDEKGGGQTVSG